MIILKDIYRSAILICVMLISSSMSFASDNRSWWQRASDSLQQRAYDYTSQRIQSASNQLYTYGSQCVESAWNRSKPYLPAATLTGVGIGGVRGSEWLSKILGPDLYNKLRGAALFAGFVGAPLAATAAHYQYQFPQEKQWSLIPASIPIAIIAATNAPSALQPSKILGGIATAGSTLALVYSQYSKITELYTQIANLTTQLEQFKNLQIRDKNLLCKYSALTKQQQKELAKKQEEAKQQEEELKALQERMRNTPHTTL